MWSSRDVALIITLAVLGFINFATVLQTFSLLTGIPGIVYGVDIIGATLSTVGFLLFEGRRWRRTAMGFLIFSIALPLNIGSSYNIITRIPIILKMLISDVVFNSFYGYFERRKKLAWLAIFQSVTFFVTSPFFDILFFSFFVPFASLTPLLNLVIIMLPLIIGLSATGGYIGYKIYRRLIKINSLRVYPTNNQ
jgi:hypothetical protein